MRRPPRFSALLARHSAVEAAAQPFDEPAAEPLPPRAHTAHHCQTTDYFAGFQITGRFQTNELIDLLQQLPWGLTEFMTHPGYHTEELEQAATRLKKSRRDELEALMARETRAALTAFKIELVRYSDL